MLSRRELLSRMGTGLGWLGLAGVLSDSEPAHAAASTDLLAPRDPHFTPRAKRIIHLYMNGGPSHVDTFDPKPALKTHQGQRPSNIDGLKTENKTGGLMPSPFRFTPHGQSGLEISELYGETARLADDICVIRSMYTDVPNHEPSMFLMNSGHVQAIRPSYGSWLLYGLGTDNQNLPGYVVLCPASSISRSAASR